MKTSLLDEISGINTGFKPVWFMRQAGRSLPEYRELRKNYGMLEACLNPQVAAEITCQPVRRHKVDAAVFFSDIMVPLKLAGAQVSIEPGIGPVMDSPIRTKDDIKALVDKKMTELDVIEEAVGIVVKELGDPKGDKAFTPVIGFAGAPFTLAAYLVEGKPSKDHLKARALIHSDPESWDMLANWCAELSSQFVLAQIKAGASVVQLFDSWAGALGEEDYRNHVMRYSSKILSAVKAQNIPTIHFGIGTGDFLPAIHEAGASVVGVDYRTSLKKANEQLGGGVVVQGNINPALLYAPWDVLEKHLQEVMEYGALAKGHIVNLGHGVPPDIDPNVLTKIVEYVHAY